MEKVSAERQGARLGPDDTAARKRAAVEMYARNERALRRTAARYSLCADDADDALQRGLEILLRKAPTDDPRELIKWTQTVVKHEALAIRRERTLAAPAAGEDWVDLVPATSAGPSEAAERSETIARSREALRALKPQELRALTLLAEGYSYAEIGEITSWSRTKVNRCLAEGRERFRSLLARSEDGRRCAELRPLISAFCDDEAGPEEVAELREHLRTCGHCRATLRAYRAAPPAAAALAPALPLHRSLLERLHEAASGLSARFGGGGGDAVAQVTSGSGAGGIGMAGLVKVAAVCLGTAGGATACVASGLVPTPLGTGSSQPQAPRERQVGPAATEVDFEPAVPAVDEHRDPEPTPATEPADQQAPEPEPAAEPAEPAPVVAEPVADAEATEYAPPPTAAPAPVESAETGSPAGEFGP